MQGQSLKSRAVNVFGTRLRESDVRNSVAGPCKKFSVRLLPSQTGYRSCHLNDQQNQTPVEPETIFSRLSGNRMFGMAGRFTLTDHIDRRALKIPPAQMRSLEKHNFCQATSRDERCIRPSQSTTFTCKFRTNTKSFGTENHIPLTIDPQDAQR